MSQHADNVRSAAALINAVATLLFWLRHLPLHLPTPRCDNEVYSSFYDTMQQVHFLTQSFPESIPRAMSVNLLTVQTARTPEGSVPLKNQVPVPPPLPKPRRPRASSTTTTETKPADQVTEVQVAPEVASSPAPQPVPTSVRGRRKSLLPGKLLKFSK